MASWREIERIRKDADAARAIALGVLAVDRDALNDWETDFMEGIPVHCDRGEISLPQAQKLLEIRDDVQIITEYRGLSLRRLIQHCHEARLDLSEDDEEWILHLHTSSPNTIRRRHVGRLMRCARQLGLVDD